MYDRKKIFQSVENLGQSFVPDSKRIKQKKRVEEGKKGNEIKKLKKKKEEEKEKVERGKKERRKDCGFPLNLANWPSA